MVGVAEPLATTVTEALADGGLRVLRVGHVTAACERIPVVMPQLVVVSTTVRPEDVEPLAERCVAVGAELLRVPPEMEGDGTAFRKTLRDAANTALIRSLRRGT